MNIAYDGKRFFHNSSGLGNYSRDLVRILASFYTENSYFLLNKNQSERGKAILNLENVSFVSTKGKFFPRQLRMGKKAQEIKADIFHGLSGELPLFWNSTPIKKVVTIHDLIFERFPEFYSLIDRKIHFWKFKKASQTADLVIAISEQTKKDIVKYLQIPESKVRVVYQGCHQAFKEVISEKKLQETKQKYQLPDRFLLNVGTVEKRKNLLSVVEALNGTNIPLIVVGKKTNYYHKIEHEIKTNGQTVHFLDHVSMHDLAAIYRLATIFIYPSLFEGFGIPIIEALFSKTPVITSNVSSLPEAGGEHSLYVNPISVSDIKNKLLHLWENEEERRLRAEKSYDFVQKFTDKAIADDLMKVYNEVLSLP